jgi:UDP-N-acetylenolpyruvoylglucosamine reductase
MISIEEYKDIKPFTTFGVPVTARYFSSISSIEALQQLIQHPVYQIIRVLYWVAVVMCSLQAIITGLSSKIY